MPTGPRLPSCSARVGDLQRLMLSPLEIRRRTLSILTSVGARNYDPVIGKFISMDPIVDPNKPQQNFGYAYSGNNPVTWKDPTGLRLDEGCGWRRTCEPRATGVVQASSRVGKGGASKWGVGASGCGWKLACPSSQATGRSNSPGGIGRAKTPSRTPGSSSGGKVPFTTQALKSTAPLVDPGFGLGLHKTDFIHDYPLARTLVNAPNDGLWYCSCIRQRWKQLFASAQWVDCLWRFVQSRRWWYDIR